MLWNDRRAGYSSASRLVFSVFVVDVIGHFQSNLGHGQKSPQELFPCSDFWQPRAVLQVTLPTRAATSLSIPTYAPNVRLSLYYRTHWA